MPAETLDERPPLDISASVLDAMADPVVAVGPDTRLLYANRAAEERFGWSLDELLGATLDHLVHPDDLHTGLLSLSSVLEKETGTLIEIRLRDRRGAYASFEIRGRAWTGGVVDGAVVLNVRETTDRRAWELGSGDAALLGAVLDHLPTVALVLDPDGTVRGTNRALTRMLLRPVEQTRGRPFLDLVAPQDRGSVARALTAGPEEAGPRQLEAALLSADGAPHPVHLVVVDLTTDRAVRGWVVVAHDISALVEARQELRLLAERDDLTGLPNRSSLNDHLRGILDAGTSPAHTVLFGDIDGLKVVNDRYGHGAGDALLVAVAERLASVTRPDDLVARLSGDEFVLVLATDDAATIAAVQERIRLLMAEPVVLPAGHVVYVGISLGIAPVDAGVTAEELLAAADAAMYVAKRERDERRPAG